MVAVGGYADAGGAAGGAGGGFARAPQRRRSLLRRRRTRRETVMSFEPCSSPPAACRPQMVCADGRPLGSPRQLTDAGALPNRQPTSAQSLCCSDFVEVDDEAGAVSIDRMAEIVDLKQAVGVTSSRGLPGASSVTPCAGRRSWYQAACATKRFASSASIRACAAPAGASSRRTGCGSPTWPAASSRRDARGRARLSPARALRGPRRRHRQLQAAGGRRSRRPSSTRTRARP